MQTGARERASSLLLRVADLDRATGELGDTRGRKRDGLIRGVPPTRWELDAIGGD
jgi:hypothetical protein